MAPYRPGRTSIKGKHRVGKQFVRKQHDYEFCLAVVKFAADTSVREAVGRFLPGEVYESAKNKVNKWIRKRAKLEAMCSKTKQSRGIRTRSRGHGTVLSADAEQQLLQWINDMRRDGAPMSASLLSSCAREIAESHGVAQNSFQASRSWRVGFLKRHRLSFRARTHQGQEALADAEARAKSFAEEVRREVAEKGITKIYNADQTAVFFELLPKRTVSPVGVRTVWVKCGTKEKQRATAMIMGDSDGNKYPLFLVFKSAPAKTAQSREENRSQRNGFGRTVWRKEIETLQVAHDARIYGNHTSWWNADLTVDFLDFHFGHRRGTTASPVMLILDHFSGHWTPVVRECATELGVVLKQVPASLTWRSQPADVAWMKPIKDALRRSWVDSLRTQIRAHREAASGEKFVLAAPTRSDVTRWITEAWNGLRRETIKKGFKRCGFLDSSSGAEENCDLVTSGGDGDDATDVVQAIAGQIQGRPITENMDLIDYGESAVDDLE